MTHDLAGVGVKMLASWVSMGVAFVFHNATALAALSAFALNLLLIAHTVWKIRRGTGAGSPDAADGG
jgi:hypothetical protein